MDLTFLAGTLLKLGGTVIGTALGGPAGGAVAGTVIGELAKQFGTAATPEAVQAAIAADPDAAAKIQAVESARAASVMAELNARLTDVQNARATTVALAEKGSPMAWGAAVVSLIVVCGFVVLSLLAMKPEAAGVRSDVVLYLLGAWQSLATSVIAYWVGSSAGSATKDAALKQIAAAR